MNVGHVFFPFVFLLKTMLNAYREFVELSMLLP